MLRPSGSGRATLTWVLALPVLVALAVAVRGGPVVLDAIDPRFAAARSGPLDVALDAVDFVGSLGARAGTAGLPSANCGRRSGGGGLAREVKGR